MARFSRKKVPPAGNNNKSTPSGEILFKRTPDGEICPLNEPFQLPQSNLTIIDFYTTIQLMEEATTIKDFVYISIEPKTVPHKQNT